MLFVLWFFVGVFYIFFIFFIYLDFMAHLLYLETQHLPKNVYNCNLRLSISTTSSSVYCQTVFYSLQFFVFMMLWTKFMQSWMIMLDLCVICYNIKVHSHTDITVILVIMCLSCCCFRK